MHKVALFLLAPIVSIGMLACVSAPPPPAPGTALVWGMVDLVPREGVPASSPAVSSYGDRRLREVKLVDYSDPGFAVVFLSDTKPQTTDTTLRILQGPTGIGFESEYGVIGAGSTLRIRNDAGRPLILSSPTLDLVASLDAGEERQVRIALAGEHTLFLLGLARARTTLFAAPGRFDRVASSGRYALSDVQPGPHELRVWHSRFPPRSQAIDLEPDASLRVDLAVGVAAAPASPEHESGDRGGHEHGD